MKQLSSNIWLHQATSEVTSLLVLDLSTGEVAGGIFNAASSSYAQQTLWSFLSGMSLERRIAAASNLLTRFFSVSSLTGEARVGVAIDGELVEVSIIDAVVGEDIIVQLPHSTAMALAAPPVVIPDPPPPPPSETMGYRTFELGDAGTGLWYVTVAARATSEALFDIAVLKNADLSTPGALGTFAVDVSNVEGLSIYSITAFTYTKAETQAKLLVVLDNPQGPRFAHEVARCSATQTTTTGSQSMTPIISVARSDGAIPAANGVPHQIDPTESYPRLRVSAVGFTSATENAVTDPAFNKPQSLVIQF